ncbi:hybrid sensor histidine kinase/response regulator transcription factor [Pedobacter rhizosphaerae]|uniref:histidine kinase n=1 Tax=Pedobacter rhizosphaerae TaxID=390241 RepID=A0A1H9TLB6_9SPHI|nr:hybrid sensor histidine kinase/response regulator transcription factor [Pedobacter rhizosphaerae]SER97423.1 Signal transduction histidine kinase [Pedobacter rhizosphaerae]
MDIRRISYLLFCCCAFLLKSAAAIDISRYRFHVMPETSYYGGIQSITKDSLGRIWYTGPDAVFMYDGNSFYQLNELASKSNPKVKWSYGSLVTDKKGGLFLATNHGLLKFNYEQFNFDLILPGKIRSICLHNDGNVYMLSGDSMFRYDRKKRVSKKIKLPTSKYFNSVISLKGNIYLSQENLLYKFDTRTTRFAVFANLGQTSFVVNDAVAYQGDYYFLTQRGGIFVTDAKGVIKKNIPIAVAGNQTTMAKKIFIDQVGMMWVATQSGLLLYDPQTQISKLLKMNLNDPFSLPNNSIWTIYGDPDQGAWIGTYGGKIAYCSLYDAYVRYFTPSLGGLNHPVVSGFQEDDLDNVWIATEGGGLNYWNRKDDTFRHFTKSEANSINSNMVKRLRFDPERKNLFISSFNGGISAYEMATKRFNNLNILFPGNKQPLTVYDFVRDAEGTWWMTDPDKNFFHRKKNQAFAETEIVKLIGANGQALDVEIEAISLDQQQNLRLVSHQGLYIADPKTLKVLRHYVIKNGPYSVNHLCSYYEASNGDLWLGTSGRGVNILKKDGRYLNFNSTNGFPPKIVFGILEDDVSGNIWFSTNEGLYFFDQKTQKFEKARFYKANSCGSFYLRSAYKTKNGEMLFGGTNGFLLFDPQYLNKNLQKPRVFFTSLLINNQQVNNVSKDSPLTKDISTLSNHKEGRISLSSNQSNIEIRFSSNSYLSADKNQFSYRMVGLSDKWLKMYTSQHAVQFFNLPSGDYIFEIKASNNDGLWGNEISSLYFHVNPPFFLSWWAYSIYTLIGLGLLFFIMRYYTNKKVFKERLALEALKEQNMRDLNQARTDFFTNISHDLKTPLTLVLEPLKQLKETVQKNDQATGYMQLIEKNVARIQRTISQLLRFREIESQKVTLNPQVGDFISFVHDVFGLFELYANKKEIETNMTAHEDHLYVAFDYDIIEKILTNLFSNALKYTSNKGYVGVKIYQSTAEEQLRLGAAPNQQECEYISVEVLNTSIGFSEEQIASLFTSFNRLSSYRPTFEESSGLGLAIVKELVDAIEGKIWMVNKTNKVSFTMMLPLKKEAGSADMQSNVYDYTISEIDDILLEAEEPDHSLKNVRKSSSILLIDDDPNLRNYLERRLSEKYNVYLASDGMEGIIKAEKIYPQLIITDLVMPNTNGFEVCSHLRQNFKTSHIPIVMISGMGDVHQNKIKALEHGATVFIDKPFEVEYLIQQIDTILKNQQEMREMYSKRLVVDPSNVTITSMDEELLIKAMKFIEQNMANPNYSVDDFVSDMNTGRTILYQKINDIVGMSIKEFILNIRLKRSAYLLEHSDLTVAEVAYQTGFNNAKYFSVCFKKQFETSPSEYKKRYSSESNAG